MTGSDGVIIPGDGPPIVFETQVYFGGEIIGGARCSTWEGAEKMHAAAVAYARTWWRHPMLLARALKTALDGWTYGWDMRFAGRYGKQPAEE